MSFVEIKGIKGKLFIPEDNKPKKYPCGDCFSCQFCVDERCRLCLRKNPLLVLNNCKDKSSS